MNQYSQQPAQFQGGQQQFSNASQNFQPTGFVQSHYQGQLSYPTFGRESASIVNPSFNNAQSQQSFGFQQQSAPAFNSFAQPAVSNQGFQSHGPVQSHASSPATAFGDVGPVIARYGFQAGPDAQQQGFSQQQNQQSRYQPAQFAQQQSFGQSGYQSHGPVHSNTSINPVYQATNAYEQAGPVIARYGYQSSSAQSNSQFSR